MSERSDLARLLGDRVALALLLLAATVRILLFVETGAASLEIRGRTNLDAYHYHRRAVRMIEGDWANKERFEYSGQGLDEPGTPRNSLSIRVFGEERYDRLNAKATYYDYPGYYYFVAVFYAVFGPETRTVLAAQALLDLVACALVYLIALRVFDRTVARVALALAACSAPLAFYSMFLLRDSVIATLNVVVVYCAVRAERPRGWALAGFAFGVAWIFKGSALVLAPFLLSRASLRGAAAFVAFSLLAISPFVARNVALEAPPLRMSCIEEGSIVAQNVPQEGVRGLDYRTFDIAVRAGHRCDPVTKWNALRVAVEEHPSVGSFVKQCLARVFEHYRADDAWCNVRMSWLAPCLRSMWLAPVRFKLIEGFVAIGIVLALADPRRRLVLLGPEASNVVMAAIGMALARYRLTGEGLHAVLAASAIVWLVREARRRRAVAIYAALAGVALTIVLHDPFPPPTRDEIRNYVGGTFGKEAAESLGLLGS